MAGTDGARLAYPGKETFDDHAAGRIDHVRFGMGISGQNGNYS